MARVPIPYVFDYPENLCREYLLGDHYSTQINWKYERLRLDFAHDLLRRYGVLFPHGEFPDIPLRFPPKILAGQCFMNATNVSRLNPGEVVYCEGFILGHEVGTGFPVAMAHGWCYFPRYGVMYDPTTRSPEVHRDVLYVGIPFKSVYVNQLAKDNNFYGMLAGHPSRGDDFGPFKDPEHHWLHPCWHSMERYYGPL